MRTKRKEEQTEDKSMGGNRSDRKHKREITELWGKIGNIAYERKERRKATNKEKITLKDLTNKCMLKRLI